MNEQFQIAFSDTEFSAQNLNHLAQELDDTRFQMQKAYNHLLSAGLEGTFRTAFDDHWLALDGAFQALIDEFAEAARDLQVVAEMSRNLDAESAVLFATLGTGAYLPEAGGAARELSHVSASIGRLQASRELLVAQLAYVRQQGANPVNRLLHLGDDYARMEADLEDAIARTDARLDQLYASQDALQSARAASPDTNAPTNGFAALLNDMPEPAGAAHTPQTYAAFAHSQYATEGDTYACALYAQTSVMEAMGYPFAETLDQARKQGVSAGWYDMTTADGDGMGSEYWGLGAVFEANGIPFDKMGGTKGWSGADLPGEDAAFARLETALADGQFPVVSILASDMPIYQGGIPEGHTVWVTGLESNPAGELTSVRVNDSHFGKQISIPIDQFKQGWRSFNYQSVFARSKVE